MDDDRENVQSRYLSIYNVPETRRLALAPQVARFGHCTALAGTRNNFEERSELEFCFRLSGAEEFAEDVMDGVIYRNRLPSSSQTFSGSGSLPLTGVKDIGATGS